MSLHKVIGPGLDPHKNWYVVKKRLCGVSASAFAGNEIFKRFPSEIKSVPTEDLSSVGDKANDSINKQPRTFVATTFGICAALIRQRELHSDFIASSNFQNVVEGLDTINLKFTENGAKPFGWTGTSSHCSDESESTYTSSNSKSSMSMPLSSSNSIEDTKISTAFGSTTKKN